MLASSATLGLLLLALVVGMTPASTSEATSRIVVTAEAEADFARASAAALAARYPLPAAAGHDEVQVGADSSCSFLPGVAYQSHNLPANVIKVPSSPEGPGLCCAACDRNTSCVAWTLQWNRYGLPPKYESNCQLFDDLPQPWAVSHAVPHFDCQRTRSRNTWAGFGGAAGCVNRTWDRGGDAVSGHKLRRSALLPPPPENQTLPVPAPTKPGLPNILYLVADDMRPQLNSFGHEYMITPNLGKLAATGLQFDFAFTQFAYCAPSRNSFMSGRRPDRTLAINFLSTFRERPGGEDWVTMPQFFRQQGPSGTAALRLFL